MAEFKVIALEEDHVVETAAQLESRLIAEKEAVDAAALLAQQVEGESEEEAVEGATEEGATAVELTDEMVLPYMRTRFGKEIDSLEDLFQEREASEELPEDVATFYKFKKETGRGIEDFMKLNRDFEKENPEVVIAEYYKEQNPELDAEDINYMLDKFKADEDIDDEADVRGKKIAQKKELAKAKEYFKIQKEQYKIPLGSSEGFVPKEERDSYTAYKNNKQAESELKAEQLKRSQVFADKTDQLFSDKFEGFELAVDENNKLVYKPGEAKSLKEQQSNLNNFIGKFLDDKGYLKDATAFHRSIAVANDPDKFARFCYEQGKADMLKEFEKDSKNIDMVRGASTPAKPMSGLQVKAVGDDHGNGLKFK